MIAKNWKQVMVLTTFVALATAGAPAGAVATSANLDAPPTDDAPEDELSEVLGELGDAQILTHSCNANCILSQCTASCAAGQKPYCECGQVNGPKYGNTQYGVGQAKCGCTDADRV